MLAFLLCLVFKYKAKRLAGKNVSKMTCFMLRKSNDQTK